MRNLFKFFIRDPSRIIFHYFHDTHPSSEVFFILTLFSLFLRFLSILSLVFSFFFLRALSLFYASTFSSHSTILSPFHGFPYPFSLLSRPHRFMIFRYTHPLLPIQSFSPSPQHLPFWFFLRSFPNYISTSLITIDRSILSNIQLRSTFNFNFSNFIKLLSHSSSLSKIIHSFSFIPRDGKSRAKISNRDRFVCHARRWMETIASYFAFWTSFPVRVGEPSILLSATRLETRGWWPAAGRFVLATASHVHTRIQRERGGCI